MVPPREPSRVAAGELGKGGKNLEGIGAKLLCPNCFQVFFNNFGGTPTHISGFLEIWKLERKIWCVSKCSFQKESVICEWRIGVRKGSEDVVLLSPPRGAVEQFNLPGKEAREE